MKKKAKKYAQLEIRLPTKYAKYLAGHLQKEHPKTKGKIKFD
jgi:thymidylate synthase ThyX